MKPFFRYYGGKYRMSIAYGPPRADLVIEPFAGSACYSTYWNVKNAKLYDISDEVCQIWDYLINCSDNDIRKLPDFVTDVDQLFEFRYPEERLMARWIWWGKGANPPTPKSSKLNHYEGYKRWKLEGDLEYGTSKRRPRMWDPVIKNRIIHQKPFIKNWTIEKISYKNVPNEYAHWHIDPPYISQKDSYGKSDLDFDSLGEWCKERQGHVDVCEMEGADWLPFKNIKQHVNMNMDHYFEVLWRKGKSGLFE